jgi:hypothetical protein
MIACSLPTAETMLSKVMKKYYVVIFIQRALHFFPITSTNTYSLSLFLLFTLARNSRFFIILRRFVFAFLLLFKMFSIHT